MHIIKRTLQVNGMKSVTQYFANVVFNARGEVSGGIWQPLKKEAYSFRLLSVALNSVVNWQESAVEDPWSYHFEKI